LRVRDVSLFLSRVIVFLLEIKQFACLKEKFTIIQCVR
jgi:hypothetical protein